MKKTMALLAAIIIASGILGGVFSNYKAEQAQTSAAPVETAGPAETAAADPVLAVYNGKNITKSEVQAMIERLAAYGSLEDKTDFKTAVEYMVNNNIIQDKIAEMGLNVFSPDEITAFSNEADIQWEKALDDYVAYYLTKDTPEARATLRTAAENYFDANGYTKDVLIENLKSSASYDRMNDYLVGDYLPDEEEVLAVFNQYGAQYQAQYEGNVPMYEYMTSYNGSESWYVPEGYRGIIHILLKADDALMAEYTRLQAAYEESQSAEEPVASTAEQDAEPAATEAVSETVQPAPAESAVVPVDTAEVTEVAVVPVTLEQVDAARAAVISSKQDVIDQIGTRLAAGEAFQALIAEYGEDPGMKNADTLAKGYSVHKDSVMYDPVFTAAAFSEKMQNIGDVSDPVVGQYGIHILYYLRDVPGGLIMTDEIRTQITDYLNSRKSTEVYTQALASWSADFSIVFNDDAIAAATSEASAAAAAAETAEATETPLEVITPEEATVPGPTPTPGESSTDDTATDATATPDAIGN